MAAQTDAPVSLKRTKVCEDIKQEITSGHLHYGERLNNEQWLCQEHHVSRTTLRNAINQLIDEGYLERRPNKGVYVTYSKFDSAFSRPFSLFQELERVGIHPSSKILYFSREAADDNLCKKMYLSPGEIILEIHRLRFSDDLPITINHLFIPEKLFPDFDPWQLTSHSLHDILKNQYNVQIAKSVQDITTAVTNKTQSELLRVALRTPVLKTMSTVTSTSGDVIDFQRSWINTDVLPYSFRFNWA